MTNCGMSVPRVLIHHYRNFLNILDFLFEEEMDQVKESEATNFFERYIRTRLIETPQVLHIFSVASHYYQQGDYSAVRTMQQMGLEYFPDELMILVFETEVFVVEGERAGSAEILKSWKTIESSWV